MEWAPAAPAGYLAPAEIDWDSPQLFVLPRIAHDKLQWSNFQFDRAQAIFRLPDVSQGTAHVVW